MELSPIEHPAETTTFLPMPTFLPIFADESMEADGSIPSIINLGFKKVITNLWSATLGLLTVSSGLFEFRRD